MSIQTNQSVGELVVERPHRSRVFEQLGIDYCCGGKLSLEVACGKRGLAVDAVVKELDASDKAQQEESRAADPSKMSLTELANHIERTHHDYLRSELGRVEQLVAKVARAHGERDPRLVRMISVYAPFQNEMMTHMNKEEKMLFPGIRALESGSASGLPHGMSIADPIRQMESEHDDAGGALEEMRELTEGFVPPAGACNTWRAMLDALSHLERDTHSHVHKENNILFPRAIAMESKLAQGRA